MQRLPLPRIQRAHEIDEIALEEYPASASLCPWDEAALGARSNLFGVHVQKGCSFTEVERLHSPWSMDGTRRRAGGGCVKQKTRTRTASVLRLSHTNGLAERFTCGIRVYLSGRSQSLRLINSDREFPLPRGRAPLTEGILRGLAEVTPIL